jgi:signal peptidase I
MTAQPYQSEEQPPVLLGHNGNGNGSVADSDVAESHANAPATPARGVSAPAPRARRAPDYRQRGLDLGAQPVAPPPTLTPRSRYRRSARHRRRLFVQWAIFLSVVALVAVALRAWVVQPYSVSTTAMAPTLKAGTDVLVVKSTDLTGPVGTGDIVVFHAPTGSRCGDDGAHLVARVIGVPGQTIRSVDGTVVIDGQRLKEPGWYDPSFGELGPDDTIRATVPAQNYYVMGDNRRNHCDSRSFGPIPASSVIGTVVATIARDGHPSVHVL